MATLTASSVVEVRRGTTGDYTSVGLAGLGNYGISRARRNRRIPALGLAARSQTLTIVDGSISIPVDDNRVTAGLFWLRSGAMFDCRVWPTGTGSGNRWIRMVGPATIGITAPEGGVRRYAVTIVGSQITEGVQS